VEQWPQSLRICVRIVLGSGYPMLISWGPEYIMIYNDAWRPIQGAKHPALSRRFVEVWPEMWDFAGPLYDRIMAQGQPYSTLTDELHPLYRNNYLEEYYFAFRLARLQTTTAAWAV